MFFFNNTATTKIYTLSLHDALPICHAQEQRNAAQNVYRSVEHDQKTGLTTFGQFSRPVQQSHEHSVLRFCLPEYGNRLNVVRVGFSPTTSEQHTVCDACRSS